MTGGMVYFELRRRVSSMHLEFFLDIIFEEMGKPNIGRNGDGYDVYFDDYRYFSIAAFERATQKLRVDLAVVFTVTGDNIVEEYLVRSGKVIQVNLLNEDDENDKSIF